MKLSKSMEDSMKMVNQFGFDYNIINIKSICDEFESKIGEPLIELSKINIRPRVRMTILYSVAQTNKMFVIGTGNLDERLLGYFTKWGDGACDLNPLGLLTKKEVKILAHHLNIPDSIINKAPSAGLYEGQTDELELGFTYEEIDNYILNGTTENEDIDNRLKDRINMSSHKLNSIPIYEV
jgi:NAD+ synthase